MLRQIGKVWCNLVKIGAASLICWCSLVQLNADCCMLVRLGVY